MHACAPQLIPLLQTRAWLLYQTSSDQLARTMSSLFCDVETVQARSSRFCRSCPICSLQLAQVLDQVVEMLPVAPGQSLSTVQVVYLAFKNSTWFECFVARWATQRAPWLSEKDSWV